MIELKGLEDWARGILAIPMADLNRRFESWEAHDEIDVSIREMPFFSYYRPVFRSLSTPTLLELHQKLRGQECETKFWILMLMNLNHPLPDEICLDLIQRFAVDDRMIRMLSHTRQSDEVTWKLATLDNDGVYTLAKSAYTDSNRMLPELEEVFRRFPNHEWMLQSLAHCSASSPEKRRAYETAIEHHPKREQLLAINRKIETNQPTFSYFDLVRLSEYERTKALYGDYGAQKLLEIARDDQTPDEILRDLEELRGFPNASAIRAAARHTFRRRENFPSE